MNHPDSDIAAWRKQMALAGIKRSEVLDELESHLREDIERRIRNGAAESRAFESAAEQMGQPGSLSAEFERIQNQERKFMKRGLLIGAAIVGVMVGMALVMPAVAQYRQIGVMRDNEPWLFLIGSLMTLGGCFAGVKSFQKKSA
jgi:hypothetical protein